MQLTRNSWYRKCPFNDIVSRKSLILNALENQKNPGYPLCAEQLLRDTIAFPIRDGIESFGPGYEPVTGNC
jgi:hypothetical protein